VFGLTAVGAAVLRVDGDVAIDLSIPQSGGSFFGVGGPEVRATVELTAGVPCQIELDYPIAVANNLRAVQVGAALPPADDGVAKAAAAAAAADAAVVVVGTNPDWETEGEDRTTMDLPGDQDALVAAVAAANPKTVVVVNAGSPVSMPWAGDVAAVMQLWFPGEEFGNSLADVLFGDVDPGGRLPVTIPVRVEDTPAFEHYPGADGKTVYGEGLLIGHRWYDTVDTAPRFAFGHGLSYASFGLGEPALTGDVASGVTVTVPVTNTSSRRGTEVVQVYVEPSVRRYGRPVRTLRGFAKVSLGPGESVETQIRLDQRAFAEWDAPASAWIVPAGEFTLRIGRSSRDLTRSLTVSR
jgi:beta-glucosidase